MIYTWFNNSFKCFDKSNTKLLERVTGSDCKKKLIFKGERGGLAVEPRQGIS